MVNQRMLGLGTARSVIRELFEYGKQRAAVVGAENVFDFSLGNPSVPAPDAINETAIRILKEQPELIHCYTSAQGDAAARQRFADSLNRRFQGNYTADQFYITVGAAASLCCVFNGLTCPGDEFIVFAPYFPEYKVFIEGAGAKMVLIPPEIEHFQIDFDALERSITPHTKGVVVNTPNNPSGVVYSRQTLEKLASVLTAKSQEYGHPIYLISDEPYREIVFQGFEVPWVPHIYKDTIVCYSCLLYTSRGLRQDLRRGPQGGLPELLHLRLRQGRGRGQDAQRRRQGQAGHAQRAHRGRAAVRRRRLSPCGQDQVPQLQGGRLCQHLHLPRHQRRQHRL